MLEEPPRDIRGKGFPDPFPARIQAPQAHRLSPLSPDPPRQGRILDIGCISFSSFYPHTVIGRRFASRFEPRFNLLTLLTVAQR